MQPVIQFVNIHACQFINALVMDTEMQRLLVQTRSLGKYFAWQSMERDGYEADLNRLFIMNLETGEKRFIS